MCIVTLVPRRPLGKARADTRRAPRALAWLASLLLPLACAGALAQPAPPPPARVGYVDMQRLIDSSPQFIAGREALPFVKQRPAQPIAQRKRQQQRDERPREAGPPDAARAEIGVRDGFRARHRRTGC